MNNTTSSYKSQVPTFSEIVRSAKEKVEKKNMMAAIYNNATMVRGKYIVCQECGNDYGNKYLPEDRAEVINNCPTCREDK